MFTSSVFYFAILAVFMKNTLALSDEQKNQIQTKFLTAGAECVKDYPLTVDDLASFKNNVFPEGENAGCFSACIFTKLGLFDDKGTLAHTTALENAKPIFEDEEELGSIQAFLTACAKVNEEEVNDGEKGCERAKLAYNCFVENYQTLGFDIDF